MDYLAVLNAYLQKGFSKSDLERLIGLPKNNLTEILKGNKSLSQKSKIKIELWEASDKPDPLKMVIAKKELETETPFSAADIEKEANKTGNYYPTKEMLDSQPKTKHDNSARILELETELTHLGKSSIANQRRKWIIKELNNLKK